MALDTTRVALAWIMLTVPLAVACGAETEAKGDAASGGGGSTSGVTAGATTGGGPSGTSQGSSGQGGADQGTGQGGSSQGGSSQGGSSQGGAGQGGTAEGGGGSGPACGNAACEPGEDCVQCEADCGACAATCGNAICEAEETCVSCPGDCGPCPPSCGNGTCDGGEDCANCAADCGACPPTEVVVAGGDCNSLQGGLDQAAATGLPLRLTSAFTVGCTVRIPSNVAIDGQAATFTFTKPGRIRNQQNGGGGGYTHAGGFVWDGGTFIGAGNGVFTISHSPGFTIRNTVQYAYAEDGDDGHSIEVNSSGGAHTPDVYTVHITGNTFLGVTGQRANSNDEPVQYDFAWDGSGGDAPFDATMTHNLYIAGNTFHRVDETGSWEFALCAIGGHRGGAGEPVERHNGILIENNAIHGAVGATQNISPNKGAIALWNARDVWVRNNLFYGCTGSRLISGWDANPDRDLNDATMNINISGNVHDGVPVTITMPASNTTGG